MITYLKQSENLEIYFTGSRSPASPSSLLPWRQNLYLLDSRPLTADLLQKQWHARQLNKDFYSLFFTPSLLAFLYQSVNRNRVWKRRELKNAERNEVFSFQMFQRHDDRFYVIVRVLKRLGDRYYIYMLFNYKEILLSNIWFFSKFFKQIPACLVILQD